MKSLKQIIEDELYKLETFEQNRPLSDYNKEWEWEEFTRKHPPGHWENYALGLDAEVELQEIPYNPNMPF